MDIVVPIKLVPDLVEELEVNEDGNDLDRDFLSFRINEYCDHAIEEAVQLKEAHGGTVTVIALDGEETDKVLYTALAKGADKVIKINGLDDDATPSTRAVAKAMAQVIGGLSWDLILAGVQAPDDRDGQLPVQLAAMLGVPHVSVVSGIAVDGDRIILHKEYSGGMSAKFEADKKVVLGIQAARETPRYAPVSRVRQLMKEAEIDEVDADIGDVAVGSSVRAMSPPESGDKAEMIDGSAEEIADRIATLLNEKRG